MWHVFHSFFSPFFLCPASYSTLFVSGSEWRVLNMKKSALICVVWFDHTMAYQVLIFHNASANNNRNNNLKFQLNAVDGDDDTILLLFWWIFWCITSFVGMFLWTCVRFYSSFRNAFCFSISFYHSFWCHSGGMKESRKGNFVWYIFIIHAKLTKIPQLIDWYV